MKLNIGCGIYALPGYVNVDIAVLPGVNVVCDATNMTAVYPEWLNKVEVIQCFHTFEHFKRSDAIRALFQWHRLLSPGGKLNIELPDLLQLCQLVALGDTSDLTLSYIFGPQDREAQSHPWGWTQETLTAALQSAGFSKDKIKFTTPLDYHSKERPCLRVEVTK